MSTMSELDAEINEVIERAAAANWPRSGLTITTGGDITTWQGDESRTAHADGSVTYTRQRRPFDHNGPIYTVYVAHTYRDGVLLHGPDFAEYREPLMAGLS